MKYNNLGERNYTPIAEHYEQGQITNPHFAHLERPTTFSLLPTPKGLRVLDAGCGPGFYSAWFVDHGAEVVSIDAAPPFVEMTKKRTRGAAQVLQWNIEEPLAFAEPETFDLILCPLVLDYIKGWLNIFIEFHRILRTNSYLIFSCTHPASSFYRDWPNDNYFKTVLHDNVWNGFGDTNLVIRYYRRSLQAQVNPFIKAGFVLDRLVEGQPTPAFENVPGYEKEYQKLHKEPCYIHYRLIKGTDKEGCFTK